MIKDTINASDLKYEVERMFNTLKKRHILNERHIFVLKKRLYENWTFQSIADKLGISRERL